MKILYIADDGTEFDNKFDCEDYEFKLDHPFLSSICFYDSAGKELNDAFSEETYQMATKVMIPTMEAVKDLQDLRAYTGFCDYEYITEPGVWEFNEKDFSGCFKLISKVSHNN